MNKGYNVKAFSIAMMVGALFLSGCGATEETAKKASAPTSNAVSGAALQFNKIIFPAGTELGFNGRLIRYEYIENAKGALQRFTLNSSDGMMELEGSTFSGLAKVGYTRRIRKEEAGVFVVNYVKKGSPVIVASYSEHVSKAPKSDMKSRVIFTWKVPG